MLTEPRVDRALKKLADTFLQDQRSVNAERSGWGQFVGQASGTQVGLYGTCSGVICTALAYGPDALPENVIRYLISLWEERDTAGSSGARNFALTARRAFYLMAIRQSKHPTFEKIIPDADRELRDRILPEGLFVSWQIDPETKSATGDEATTALAILAYALTAPYSEIPPEIQRSASALQTRIEGQPSVNLGIRKFLLTSVSLGMDSRGLGPRVRRLILDSAITPATRDQDALYFWDYKYKGEAGTLSRRDWLHVPSDAVDIILASGHASSELQRKAALGRAAQIADAVLESGVYFGGREPATSKVQAWIALAIQRSKMLIADQAELPLDSLWGRIKARFAR